MANIRFTPINLSKSFFLGILICFQLTDVVFASDKFAYECKFDFELENRFPCSGATIIDGDGQAHFTIRATKSKTNQYKFKITHIQPAVLNESGVCLAAINKTFRTTAKLKTDNSKSLKLTYFDSSSEYLKIKKPLTKSVNASFTWIFGYSGASSRPSVSRGSCTAL